MKESHTTAPQPSAQNASVTITPAANGYIVSMFDQNTPDRVFIDFEDLVDYLSMNLKIHYRPGRVWEPEPMPKDFGGILAPWVEGSVGCVPPKHVLD